MQKSQGFYWMIRAWMVVAVILFNVSIQAEEAPEIVIQKGHKVIIWSLAISCDGKYIASGSLDRSVLTAGTMDEEAVMGDKWNNHSVYTFYLLKGRF